MDLQARQARSGINRFGERMGKDEKGRPIDMFETGNLLFRSASYRILESPDGIEVEVEYTAPYASTLDARYKWIGLAVAAQQQFDTDAEKILLDKVEVTDE